MSKRVGNQLHFSRNDLKRSIMTAFYGSEAVPREVFGEGKLLAAFFQTLEEETPYVWELNKAFLTMWDPTALKYSWVLPDNFHVHTKVMDQTQETVEFMGDSFTTVRNENKAVAQGRSLGANITHSIDGMIVRELLRRCSYKPEQMDAIRKLVASVPTSLFKTQGTYTEADRKVITLWELYLKSGYLSARILDYLDSSNVYMVDPLTITELLDSMPQKSFRIIPVHDCFRVHPNYGNDLRKQYNLQLALIAKSDMLSFLLSQVLNQSVAINKQADLFNDILTADYALS
jgi:hypothetical protein